MGKHALAICALGREAFRLSRGGPMIVEYPEKLMVGDTTIPVSGAGRPMRVRFIPDGAPQIPRVSLAELIDHPALVTAFTGEENKVMGRSKPTAMPRARA